MSRKVRPEDWAKMVFIKSLKQRAHFRSKATLAGVSSQLRCFGEYLLEQGIWLQNPMRWVRGSRLDPRGKKLPPRTGAEHLGKIWEQAGKVPGVYQRQLAVAVLSLLHGTGLRRGELELLNLEDWRREESLLRRDGRKTGWELNVPLAPRIGNCLEAYVPYRQNQLERFGTHGEQAFLIDRKGQRLSAQSLELLVHRLARRARVPLVSLHQFRHTCASDLLESGASLNEVKRPLGHRVVTSTCRDLHVADLERARAMTTHPLNDYLKELLTLQDNTL